MLTAHHNNPNPFNYKKTKTLKKNQVREKHVPLITLASFREMGASMEARLSPGV